MSRDLGKKLALSIFSVVVLGAAAETAYRINLYWKWRWAPPDPWLYSYTVYSQPQDRFHAELGFEYPPDTEIFGVFCKQGYPYYGWPVRINRLGNVGGADDLEQQADVRVLVLGDSFTALQLEGLTWPDMLQAELPRKLKRSVQVFNCGRGGYGVMHMLYLAAARIPDLKPDLVVFAFIADDLTRARYWRTVNTFHGMTRVLTTARPDPEPSLAESVDSYMVNSRVNQAWYDEMVAVHSPADPVLAELNDQCRIIKRQNARYIPFATLTRSFVYHRLVHRNPMHGLPKPSELPRIEYDSFAQDEGLVAQAAAIRGQNVPCLLFQLPERQDIQSGKTWLTDQQQLLRNSLSELLRAPVHILLDRMPPVSGRIEDLFWPVDGHPSRLGLERIAQAAVEVILQENDRLRVKSVLP